MQYYSNYIAFICNIDESLFCFDYNDETRRALGYVRVRGTYNLEVARKVAITGLYKLIILFIDHVLYMLNLLISFCFLYVLLEMYFKFFLMFCG